MALLPSVLSGSTPALYTFTTHTFTPAGATGSSGPTLSQIQSAYSSQPWASNTSFLNMSTQGVQLWTVPKSGTYTIEARGARGGLGTNFIANGCIGGLGAIMRVTVNLTGGQVLQLIVGQQGLTSSSGSGGGGASWIVNNSNSELILVAGGGGGSGHNTGWGAGGSINNDQNANAGGHGCAPTVTIGYGGAMGPMGIDGTYAYGGAGGGGAGWLSNGGDSGTTHLGGGGTKYIGGTSPSSYNAFGGFGGGGGGGGNGVAGGGGGGYTGGGGGADYATGGNTWGPTSGTASDWGGGGGGGSYYIPSATLVSATAGTNGNTAGTTDQPGYITITGP